MDGVFPYLGDQRSTEHPHRGVGACSRLPEDTSFQGLPS